MPVKRKLLVLARIVLIIFTVLWMTRIYLLSAEPALLSDGRSAKAALKISSVISDIRNMDKEEELRFAESIGGLIRKCAHMYLYAVLALLVYGVLLTYGISNKVKVCLSFLIALLYAAGDEAHQLGVAGRSGQLGDVLIDAAGALAGLAAALTVRLIIKKLQAKRAKKNSGVT